MVETAVFRDRFVRAESEIRTKSYGFGLLFLLVPLSTPTAPQRRAALGMLLELELEAGAAVTE